MPNTYGFITKIFPDSKDTSFFKPNWYFRIFEHGVFRLKILIESNPQKTFLISKLGSGLANKYGIWKKVVKPGIEKIRDFSNVVFLWES